MKFGSVCSGIEAASVAWNNLGWEASWFAEIEPFPSAILAHHYPSVPNLGDMALLPERIVNGEIEAPDILCGGTPCQAFSVAGNRQSLDDARGNLTLTFCEIADAIDTVRLRNNEQPAVIFWENVPGVFSTKDNAFGCFLGQLAGEDLPLQPAGKKWTNAGVVHGHKRTIAWRTLDAQYFGVAQRRRRVFVVASASEGFCPAEVLFEFDGLRRDTAPSRKAGKAITTDAQTSVGTYNKQRIGEYNDEDIASTCAARDYKDATDLVTMGDVAGPLDASYYKGQGSRQGGEREFVAYALQGNMIGRNDNAGPQGSGINEEICFTQNTTDYHAVAFAQNQLGEVRESQDVFNTLNTNSNASGRNTPLVNYSMVVRRLTPTECERLQGFPDSYTKIPWRNKPAEECPDGSRYKSLGNSWAVPVVHWIGKRIDLKLRGETK